VWELRINLSGGGDVYVNATAYDLYGQNSSSNTTLYVTNFTYANGTSSELFLANFSSFPENGTWDIQVSGTMNYTFDVSLAASGFEQNYTAVWTLPDTGIPSGSIYTGDAINITTSTSEVKWDIYNLSNQTYTLNVTYNVTILYNTSSVSGGFRHVNISYNDTTIGSDIRINTNVTLPWSYDYSFNHTQIETYRSGGWQTTFTSGNPLPDGTQDDLTYGLHDFWAYSVSGGQKSVINVTLDLSNDDHLLKIWIAGGGETTNSSGSSGGSTGGGSSGGGGGGGSKPKSTTKSDELVPYTTEMIQEFFNKFVVPLQDFFKTRMPYLGLSVAFLSLVMTSGLFLYRRYLQHAVDNIDIGMILTIIVIFVSFFEVLP
jgi:uncharacterized membrane protein YgcG